jgi:hypothetical protein
MSEKNLRRFVWRFYPNIIPRIFSPRQDRPSALIWFGEAGDCAGVGFGSWAEVQLVGGFIRLGRFRNVPLTGAVFIYRFGRYVHSV